MRGLFFFVTMLLVQGCNVFDQKSSVGKFFRGGISVSPESSSLALSAQQVTTSSSITVSFTAKDQNGTVYLTPIEEIEFYIASGSSTGSFSEIRSIGNGVYSAEFTAIEAGTPIVIGARIAGEEIKNPAAALEVIASSGVAIANVLNSYINLVNVASFALTGTCSENGRAVSLSGSVTASTTCTSKHFSFILDLSSLAQGSFSLTVSHSDENNNVATATKTFIKDTQAPTVTINTAPDLVTSLASANFSFSGSDLGIAVYECKLNLAAYTPCVSPLNFSSLSEGAQTLLLRATDVAGNTGPALSFVWTVDQTGPVLTLTTHPAGITNVNSASFTFTASDTGGGSVARFECSQNGGTFATCSSPVALSGLTAGPLSFAVRAIDSVANAGAAVSFNWILDQSAPTVTLSSPVAAFTSATSMSLSFSGADTGGGSVSGFQCRLDAGTYVACSSPEVFTGLGAGSHSADIRSIDSAGNISAPISATWTVDLTAPSTTISSQPSLITNQTTGSFSFAATDSGGAGVNGYECRLDAGAYASCSSPKVYASLAAGVHNFSVRSSDTAGNTGSPDTYSWTLDLVAPTVSFSSSPALVNYSSSAGFTFTGVDTGGGSVAGYECQLDATAYAACASPQNLTSLSNASHTFRVRATDTAGNTGVAAVYTWSVDSTSSLAAITSSPAAVTNLNTASFAFSASMSAGASGFECRLDSGSYASCVSPKSYSTLAEGGHTFSVRPLDGDSHPGAEANYSWIVDLSNPSVVIATSPSNPSNSSSTSFTFTSADTGGASIAGYECKLDAAAYSACATPLNLSSLAQGSHTLLVKSVDTAGNKSSAATYSWTLDLTAPTATFSSTPLTINNSSSANFIFSGLDTGGAALSGFECSMDSATLASCTSPINLTSLAAGDHNFRVRALDTAGNSGSLVTFAWTIDQSAPTVTLTSVPTSLNGSASASVSFTGADTGGGAIASYQCAIDSGAYSACTSPKTFTGLTEASHTASVKALDTAGNVSSVASTSWTVDLSGPTVAIDSGPSGLTNSASASFAFSGVDTGGGAIASYSCKVDAAAYASCASPTTFSALTDGSHTLSVKATDTVGNTGPVTTRSWTSDTLLPVLAISNLSSSLKGGASTTLNWTLTEANVSSAQTFTLQYSLDDGASWSPVGTKAALNGPLSVQAFSQAWTLPASTNGFAKVRVSYTDLAGNIATPAVSAAFAIDSTAPAVSSFTLGSGSATTALPTVTLAIAAADVVAGGVSSTITDMQFSETNAVDTNAWIAYSASSSFTLSQTSGDKTVYAWVRDAVGNVSASRSATIKLDFGSPPSLSISSPSAGSTYAVGDAISIAWNCSSANGLDAYPVPFIRYTIDDGDQFFDIASDLTNNITASTGSYSWTLPATAPTSPTPTSMTGKPFKILLSCKSLAGVVKTAYSQPVNSGGWSIYMGDPWYGLTNVSASIADVSGSGFLSRSSVTADKYGNVFYVKNSGVMKIDKLTGFVTTFAGDPSGSATSAGCTVVEGSSPTASGTNYMNQPALLGVDAAGDGVLIMSTACQRIFSINSQTNAVTKLGSFTTSTISRYFLAKNGQFIYYNGSNWKMYIVDLNSANNAPVQIHGTGACAASVTPGAAALTAPMKGADTGACTTEGITLVANSDASRIWINMRGPSNIGTQNGYRLDYDAASQTYVIGTNDNGWIKPFFYCWAVRYSTTAYCVDRDGGANVTPFDTTTANGSWGSTFTLAGSATYLALGSSNSRLLIHNAYGSISEKDTVANTAVIDIAGQELTTMGNGSDPNQVGLYKPTRMTYSETAKTLWLSTNGNFNSYLRKSDFSSYPTVTTSTNVINRPGSDFISPGWMIINVVNTIAAWPVSGTFFGATKELLSTKGTSTLVGFTSTNPAQTYPPISGQAASSAGEFFTTGQGVVSLGRPIFHSNGLYYFAAKKATGSDVFIFSSNSTVLNRVAGKTGVGAHLVGDDNTAALGAALTDVKHMQEIRSGTYAGDILIVDGTATEGLWLRRIGMSDSPAPKIHDVVSLSALGLTASTSFNDFYYDVSSETGGMGTGKMYWITSSNVVQKMIPASDLLSATISTYVFTGQSFTGTARLALTPAGLLVLQPNKNRILRVTP
ncbi:MAG: hypothetical protein ABIR96_00395 [Bdellovibrionota bacterium]